MRYIQNINKMQNLKSIWETLSSGNASPIWGSGRSFWVIWVKQHELSCLPAYLPYFFAPILLTSPLPSDRPQWLQTGQKEVSSRESVCLHTHTFHLEKQKMHAETVKVLLNPVQAVLIEYLFSCGFLILFCFSFLGKRDIVKLINSPVKQRHEYQISAISQWPFG